MNTVSRRFWQIEYSADFGRFLFFVCGLWFLLFVVVKLPDKGGTMLLYAVCSKWDGDNGHEGNEDTKVHKGFASCNFGPLGFEANGARWLLGKSVHRG